jgi:hypothetical protein
VIGVLDTPSDDEDLQCVEYRAVVYERKAFARDRSSELIDEWDSIHLDGVSWLSSDGTVEVVCRTLGVTLPGLPINLELAVLRRLIDISLLGLPGSTAEGVARMDSNVRVMALALLARCVRTTTLALIDKNHRTV